MKYFHCPTTYRRKQYGCGFGPVDATQAFLDFGTKCPKCGQILRPNNDRKKQYMHRQKEYHDATDFVKKMFGDAASKSYTDTHKP